MDDETDIFLGANPTTANSSKINISDEISARLKSWLSKGLTEKEEKEKLIKLIARKGTIDLEAPSLNEEISVDLHPKALAKDDYFKDYQNFTGSALSATSYVLDMISNDMENPLDRELILSNVSSTVKLFSTTYLFGDNLRNVIESLKAMERVSKDLKPKTKAPLRQNNHLNWKSSSAKKEVGRTIFKSFHQRENTFKNNRTKPYPAKRNYLLTQPNQNRR
ncbi:uncharacterized protein LOC122505292 [Leptopilina heterotoma]|uniref:uncharacterized protein LOC122505292 n=1 Tax=Leptopilina heterotoma TaxID=63436 RepID=UPI001CA94048|nr:uncharacterized protein LOC122505292 [Leptopilina heterotoma]